MRRSRVTAARVYTETQGNVLAQALTSTWADGGSVAVEFATDFSEDGGEGVFEPGTSRAEAFSYSGILIAESDAPGALDYLTGVTRAAPQAHSSGTFVQEGARPTIEKLVDGYLDGSERITPGIPVSPLAYPLIRKGAFDYDSMPVLPIDVADDGSTLITDGIPGAVPSFDDDLEVLPPVGGGDSTNAITDPDSGKVLPPKGQGFEDGLVPAGSLVVQAFGGIGNTIFVSFTTLPNSSAVTYDLHCHTTAGFTPSASTRVESRVLAGTPGFKVAVTIKDFPAGHVLDGTASDPPKPSTVYRVVVVPRDGSGAGTPSAEVAVSPLDIDFSSITGAITQTQITDGSISTPKLAANAVTAAKIAVGTITANEIATISITGDRIAGTTITADKLSVSSLSAISANIGSVTAGSISGVSISGGSIASGTGSDKITLSGSTPLTLNWFVSGLSFAGEITGSNGLLSYTAPGGTTGKHRFNGTAHADGLIVGTTAPALGLGEISMRKSGNTVVFADSAGKTASLTLV